MIKANVVKQLLLILMLFFSITTMQSAMVKGKIVDKVTNEPLIGATIMAEGTSYGCITDLDGNYSLDIPQGNYSFIVRYLGYETITIAAVSVGDDGHQWINFDMMPSSETLEEVTVAARRIYESEGALLDARMLSSTAIESVGAMEMDAKGLSDVQQGVKRVTGVSVAEAGELIVRGLGDRYSITTLNGLTIASPNPDNKLIPLDIFPSSIVQNISVSKVYDAKMFADYSGAHIDIKTKDSAVQPFFNISLSSGGYGATLGKAFYRMDGSHLWCKTALADGVLDMSLLEFDAFAATHDVFTTSMDVTHRKSLPSLSGALNMGRQWSIGRCKLDVLGSLTMGNSSKIRHNSFQKTLEATGNVQNDFTFNEYIQSLNIAALGYVGLSFRESDHIGYTIVYARNAQNAFQQRVGIDAEGHHLIGNNSTTHIYSLLNHQLNGRHAFGAHWQWLWSASYGSTSSEEPDRRQMMFDTTDGTLKLFKLNRQETMRYYGSLQEREVIAHTMAEYHFGNNSNLCFGFDYKNKRRSYQGTRFYYNLSKVNSEISDIYTPSQWLDMEDVVIERKMQPKDSYRAFNDIASAFITTDIYVANKLLISPGLRYEFSRQSVDYASDGGEKFGKNRTLQNHELFPTLNCRLDLKEKESLRLALSRTITRPQFVEMAPFLYQESYGAAQIRGNEQLQNGYNYNIDCRYERLFSNGDMVSATAYYKYLDAPIERVQMLNGGATIHSFQNAQRGMAAGIEIEARKKIVKDLRIAANISYMYTDVNLPEGGAYTNKDRSLQGASPILINADITWNPHFADNKSLTMALLYNMQGRRIHAVGVSGLGDIMQEPVHTMNFNTQWQINKHLTIKAQINDILSQPISFRQTIPLTKSTIEVERYKEGMSFEIGISYKI